MTAFTESELMEVCRRYYPAGLSLDDHDHGDSPEWRRFHSKWHEAMAHPTPWRTLLGKLDETFPLTSVGDATAYTHDGGYRCCIEVIKPNNKDSGSSLEVVGCVSVLAPVYFIYGTQHRYRGGKREHPAATLFLEALPAELAPSALKLARTIESVFGYTSLAVQLASVPVPNLCIDHFQPAHATLLRALFTVTVHRVTRPKSPVLSMA